MKTVIHPTESRGFFDHGWLKTAHTFSFAGYFNPDRMNFGMLRVLNDDIVLPLHADSEGNESTINPGEVQVMSAGTGIRHSETNASITENVNFLQIWIYPLHLNIKPRYDQMLFNPADMKNRFQLLVSPDESMESLQINQNAYIHRAVLDKGFEVDYRMENFKDGIYIFVIDGLIEIGGAKLLSRDGIGITEVMDLPIKAMQPSDILVIEVPMNPI